MNTEQLITWNCKKCGRNLVCHPLSNANSSFFQDCSLHFEIDHTYEGRLVSSIVGKILNSKLHDDYVRILGLCLLRLDKIKKMEELK